MKESLVLRGVSLGRTVGPWSVCFSHLIRQAASFTMQLHPRRVTVSPKQQGQWVTG